MLSVISWIHVSRASSDFHLFQEGVFHFNTYLGLELASPHFKSGRATEEFHLIVMRSKADGSVSFAIDDFPEMREDAIETYWINKVRQAASP